MHRKLSRTAMAVTTAVGLAVAGASTVAAQEVGAGAEGNVDAGIAGLEGLIALLVGLIGSLLGGLPLPL